MFLFYDIYIYTRRLFVFKCCAVAALLMLNMKNARARVGGGWAFAALTLTHLTDE